MNMLLPSTREHERWNDTIPIQLGDLTVRTLDLEDTIIQALLHLFRDNFADLLHCNDVRLMMAAGPDWDEVERRAGVDGWTDIVRFAAWFVAEVFGTTSPLPTTITRWRKLAIDAVWPRSLLLHGGRSVTRSDRRQSAVGILVENRRCATANAYAQRMFPPRTVVDQRAGSSNLAYPVALVEWRLRQRRIIRIRREEAQQ